MSNLVNHSVTNIINGVSQQDVTIRLDNQLEEQINGFSDITKGLTKRNGLELLNVSPIDLTNRLVIDFNVDGRKIAVGLDTTATGEELIHIPLSNGVTPIATSLVDPEYFQGATQRDIEILEDKDKVYVLNKTQKVGTATGRSVYYDIKTVNESTNIQDDKWTQGEYTVTVTAVRDPDYPAETEEVHVHTMDRDETLQDLAASINDNVDLVAQTGPCVIEGTIDSYRLTFREIPSGWVLPDVQTAETVSMNYVSSVYNNSGWRYYGGNNILVTGTSVEAVWYFNSVEIYRGPDNRSTVRSGNFTYSKGSLRFSDNDSSGDKGYKTYGYAIRREESYSITNNYKVFTQSSTQTAQSANEATQAMVWVTGVSRDQTYDVTVHYHLSSTPETILTKSVNTSVGDTATNIKLNWVAGDIKTKIATDGNLNTVQYDNAVLIQSATGYVIKDIEVSNSFDTSSITGVVEAIETNEAGIQSIDNLPPQFSAGFLVRVNPQKGEDTADYYMQYNAEFLGWKEKSIDESRIIEGRTMPYVIDKQLFREQNEVKLAPIFWGRTEAGDSESNADPSFIDRTINDMFIYGSRLGFATDDTLVLSKIDEPTQFYRTTTVLVSKSDRVDIKLDSSKIGFSTLKHVVSYEGRLLLNTGTSQSVLLVNTAFDLTSARLSEVSSYTLGDNKPLPIGNSVYFSNSSSGKVKVFDYIPLGNNTYEAIDLTKHIPRYIRGNLQQMGYDSNVFVARTDDDAKVLYVQNRYSTGGQIVQNAWHKWVLPFDVKHFYFFNNDLYVIMTAKNDSDEERAMITKYTLEPNEVQPNEDDIYIGWTPLLDCFTKNKTLVDEFSSKFYAVDDQKGFHYDTIEDAYADTEVTQVDEDTPNLLGPFFNDSGVADYSWTTVSSLNTIIWNDGTPIQFGQGSIPITFDVVDELGDGFRYFRGDEVTPDSGIYEVSRVPITTQVYYLDNIIYGVKMDAELVLSKIIPRQQTAEGFVTMNFSKLMLRRMRLLLGNSGVFEVTVELQNRPDVKVKYTGLPVGSFVLGRGTISDINMKFPINALSHMAKITIRTLDSTPFNLLSTEWQGQLINKGRNI